jgi:predicted nuclease of predicted toxin-antitoxin system
MRLLIDMNLTPRWVEFLQNAGYEAVHWSSVGSNSAKDGEICDYARQSAYVLLTNDLDFPQILAHTRQVLPVLCSSAANRLYQRYAVLR